MRRFNWLGLTLMVAVAACQSMTEAGESGTRWDIMETATETRSGVTLVVSYNSATQSFEGTVRNTTDATVTDVRVEIHLSNGTELGPTPRVALNAQETRPVTLDARGQNFDWYSVHVELGGGEHG
ncbi:MAG: hypothetical protein OXU74_10940 [Gemmatimonadota bacterium]|nr:hypothetical protein [Gemmatimonadota bacterium]